MSTDIAASKKFEAEIDELLGQLTEEELNELNSEVDPDNSLLPPSQRCKDQTAKEPTGKFDREALLQFLEDKAKNEKDWEENKPYVKQIRGKVYERRKQEAAAFSKDELASMGFESDLGDDLDQTLKDATEEELVDLAAILGFTAMLTQEQVNAAYTDKPQEFGGFSTVTKAEKLKLVQHEKPNDTNVGESITKLNDNDASLKDLNLNNIKNISAEDYEKLFNAIKENTVLESLSCANTCMLSSMAENLVDALRKNSTLKKVNIESNFVSGEVIVKLARAITNEPSGVTELRACNQRQSVLGVQKEQELTSIILTNNKIRCFAVDLETADARCRILNHVVSNIDGATRQKRRGGSMER